MLSGAPSARMMVPLCLLVVSSVTFCRCTSVSGTQITSTCNDTADVQCRHFQAKQAFGALAKRCFASHELDVGTKVDFFVVSSGVSFFMELGRGPGHPEPVCVMFNMFVMASLRRITQ